MTSTSEWRRALAYLPFFLVGIGFIGIIGILWSSFVTLVPHTRSRCKYANRRNSHQIVKRSRVQLFPVSLNPTIAPFKYSPRFHRSLPPGNGTCSNISHASKNWFQFDFEDESTSWLYHQLLDPPQIWFWRWVNFLVVSPVVGPTSPDSGRTRSPNRRFPRVATYIQQRSDEHKHSQDLVLNLKLTSH